MNKRINYILAIIAAICFLYSCAFAAQAYKIDLEVKFHGNAIFSKYDVELYLNNQRVTALKHGTDYSGTVYADDGENTLFFYKVDDHNVYGRIDLNIQNNGSLSCTISCNRGGIKVENIDVQFYQDDPESSSIQSTDEAVVQTMEEQVLSMLTVKPSEMKDVELDMLAAMLKTEQAKRNTVDLTLQEESITINAGENYQLDAFLSNSSSDDPIEASFKWTSQNLEIASCRNGMVTGLSGGQTTITCTATLNNEFTISKTCSVHVNAVAEEVVSNKTGIDIMKGEAANLECQVLPENAVNKELTFRSENEYVASVDAEGKVQANHAGEANIVVCLTDEPKKNIIIKVRVMTDRYFEDSNAKKIFDEITAGKELSVVTENGDQESFDQITSYDGIIFSVKSAGANGEVQLITAIDVKSEEGLTVLSDILSCFFKGEDAAEAVDWLKTNQGKKASTKIKDANLILKTTPQKKMILYISDDDHLEWAER